MSIGSGGSFHALAVGERNRRLGRAVRVHEGERIDTIVELLKGCACERVMVPQVLRYSAAITPAGSPFFNLLPFRRSLRMCLNRHYYLNVLAC